MNVSQPSETDDDSFDKEGYLLSRIKVLSVVNKVNHRHWE